MDMDLDGDSDFLDLNLLLLELKYEDLRNEPDFTFSWNYCHLGWCDPECNHLDAESQGSSSESLEDTEDDHMEENYGSDELEDEDMEQGQDNSEENTLSGEDTPATWEELLQLDDED